MSNSAKAKADPHFQPVNYDDDFKYGLSRLHKKCSDTRNVDLRSGKAQLKYTTLPLCFINVVEHAEEDARNRSSYSRFFWNEGELPEENSHIALSNNVSAFFNIQIKVPCTISC